ncbi:MAG TPA: sulfatase [Candidatus Polarisedimenticolaceae bacterium]|nr:sulfatase [Candidatus Polarisedimenticolaceae bacterium]
MLRCGATLGRLVRTTLIAPALLAAPEQTGAGPAAVPRNLVLVSIDTLRADRLGCYGHPRPTSPVIDALARDGVIFDDASAPSPWTKPSHGALLSGRYPSRNGLTTMAGELDAQTPHLAELLRDAGFQTVAIVNSKLLTQGGLARGFDHVEYLPYRQGDRRGSPVSSTAVELLDRRDQRRRLFAFIHYMDVHSDYVSLPRYEEMFVRPYDGYADGSTQQLYRFSLGLFDLDRRDADHLLDLYDAGIRQIDDRIGRLVDYLKQQGLLDETLVVVLSDHGEEFLEHGSVLHGHSQFQEVVRVPLLLCGPTVPRGVRVSTPVSLVDVMPTVIDLLGLPLPDRLDGLPLRGAWDGSSALPPGRELFFEADVVWPPPGPGLSPLGPYRAVRSGRFKLHYDVDTKHAGLFDLERDPGETVNVIADHPNEARRLWRRLERFLAGPKPADETGSR